MKLAVSEIFHSIQGEGPTSGMPTSFVRIVGCPLRCRWCDTEYAFTGGTVMTDEEIITIVEKAKLPAICVTGGEPLAHKHGSALVAAMCDAFETQVISVETSGAYPTNQLPRRVRRIVDWKAPSSGEGGTFLPEILDDLGPSDALKFVITNDEIAWLQACIQDADLVGRQIPMYVHPIAGETDVQRLAQDIIDQQMPVRLGVQLHKLLWPNETQGV